MIWPLLLLTGEGGGEETPAEGEGSPPPSSTTGRGIDEDEEIRDPKALVKSLREANARLAKKLDKKDAKIKELEGQGDIRSVKLEAAFTRAVFEYRDAIDLETAWDLANLKGYLDVVKLADDGTVDMETMDQALDTLVARYPYLIQDGQAGGDSRPPPKTRHPRSPNSGKKATDETALAKRFPALRGRQRRPW